jgi:hypothetical protein
MYSHGSAKHQLKADIIVGLMTDSRQGKPAGGSTQIPKGFEFKDDENGKVTFGGSHSKTTWWITTKRFNKGDEVKFNAGSGMYYWFAACGNKHPEY